MVKEKTLPDVGFQYIRTIGGGAFAVIKEARKKKTGRSVAIKLIDKELSHQRGIDIRDIRREITLHKHCCPHANVVDLLGSGENEFYYWIGMELASGGDLFDKIEPDVGINEEVANFYFRQLVNGVFFLHSKGVAHRDLKPENIFLDENGNLKIGDFGLAALFRNPANGQTRLCGTSCGSPPYIAPEVLDGKYKGDKADIWSCGIILFVLLCGATPWSEPLIDDGDFHAFTENNYLHRYPWNKTPLPVVSLIKAMIRMHPDERYSIDSILLHPWVNSANTLLGPDGKCTDPVSLATQLLSKLHVSSTASSVNGYDNPCRNYIGGSQPIHGTSSMFMSQSFAPMFSQNAVENIDNDFYDFVYQDPGQVQFSGGGIPETISQRATKFGDLIPSSRFTRFYSIMPLEVLGPKLISALNQTRAKIPDKIDFMSSAYVNISPELRFMTLDRKKLALYGKIKFTLVSKKNFNGIIEVMFQKDKGDPLEWRYFFKQVVRLCIDCVVH